MFCPNCGSKQSEGKKFCTVCGTNLSIVSHALGGYTPPPPPPVADHAIELERQREMSKGVRLTILGGGFFSWGMFKFLTPGLFLPGPKYGVWLFIGFVLLAYGISKLVSFRPLQIDAPPPNQIPISPSQYVNPPRPVFSGFQPGEYVSPRTSELDPARPTGQSVTEDETQQLPRGKSTRR